MEEREAQTNDGTDSGVNSETEPTASAPGAAGVAAAASTKRRSWKIPRQTALIVVLVAEFLFFSIQSEFFFRLDNQINLLQNVAVIGIIAVAATLLLVAGQVDLSVGSAAGFIGMTMAVAATATDATTTGYGIGLSIAGALVVGILAALLIGVVNGFLVTRIGLNSIITTLATLAILRGLTKVIGEGQTIRINDFNRLGIARPLFDIPLPVYLFGAVVIIFWFVLRYTVYGRSMYAIGANPEAARLAGIRVQRMIFFAFILSALAVALASLIRLSQIGGASVNAGLGFELSALT
ncbi:MAG: ABC transporter permease, partial [Chloroflexi bacterium]|nr:ABC transporter permease [Chloroflexota bacterium]